MKVWYNPKKKKWATLPDESKHPESIYLDGFLKKKLDLCKKLLHKSWDIVIIIDGLERSGKSTLGKTIGWYLSDTKLTPYSFAQSLEECAERIKNAHTKDVIIIDEGSLIFSSKDAMVKAQRQLLKILDVCGQRNLVLIICLPSFFDLVKQIAVRRSRFLLHVYHDKEYNRGYFTYYSSKKKKILYIKGKENGTYKEPKPNFKGKFTNFRPSWDNEYQQIKDRALFQALDVGDNKSGQSKKNSTNKLNKIDDAIIQIKKNNPKLTNMQLAQLFGVSERLVVSLFAKKRAEERLNSGAVITLPYHDSKSDTEGKTDGI